MGILIAVFLDTATIVLPCTVFVFANGPQIPYNTAIVVLMATLPLTGAIAASKRGSPPQRTAGAGWAGAGWPWRCADTELDSNYTKIII